MQSNPFYCSSGWYSCSSWLVWTLFHAGLLYVSLNLHGSCNKVNSFLMIIQPFLEMLSLSHCFLWVFFFSRHASWICLLKAIVKRIPIKDEVWMEASPWGLEIWIWFGLQVMMCYLQKIDGVHVWRKWNGIQFLFTFQYYLPLISMAGS